MQHGKKSSMRIVLYNHFYYLLASSLPRKTECIVPEDCSVFFRTKQSFCSGILQKLFHSRQFLEHIYDADEKREALDLLE